MKFEVKTNATIETIEESLKEGLLFVIEDGKLFCIVPEE